MFHSTLCVLLILCPFIRGHPQFQYSGNRYDGQQQRVAQDYTDSPDAKIISLNPEPEAASLAPQPAANVYGSRGRQQAARPVVVPADQYQSQPIAPVPVPPQSPAASQAYAAAQYQETQPQQYESQYVQPAAKRVNAAGQQAERHEHRHSTTTYIPILKFDKSQALDGSYKQSFETGNNIQVEETGYLKNLGNKDLEALVQQGSYTYTAPDGSVITTTYTADEGGFHVEGSHLPTPPPIPEEIRRGLEQIYEGIRLQQEADARDAKNGKSSKSNSYDENSVVSDNYPQQYQQQQQQQQQQLEQHYQEPYLGRQVVKAQRKEFVQSQQQYQETQQQYQQ